MDRHATPLALLLTVVASVGLACSDPITSADADADTDADADAEADAEADRDLDAEPETGPDADAGPPPELAAVGHERELRGVWVASVGNINWPSRQGLTAEQGRAELVAMVELLASLRMNAIFFQVRPEGDALYRSELEPWSRFLTGTQGGDPGFDPLASLIEEAHPRGIEVHAWLNPYRAKSNASSTAVAPHMSVAFPEYAYRYGTYLWMDPGAAPVRARGVAVVADLVTRYEVDGIHFDDYFYPYPDGTPFPDDATYRAYLDSGGTLERGDWRRENVNRFVEEVSAAVSAIRPDVRFGISPFGIYRPGIPEGITGLDQYAAIFADPVRWAEAGWVEYLAPQLYWPSTQTPQAYGTLIEWWSGLARRSGRTLLAGNYLSQLGSSAAWSVDEIRVQMDLTRAERESSSLGNIFFHIGPLQEDRLGIAGVLRDEYYGSPASSPPLSSYPGAAPAHPGVRVEGGTARLAPGRADERLRSFAVYRDDGGGGFVLDRLVPAAIAEIPLPPGRFAISAIARSGLESQGLVVRLE